MSLTRFGPKILVTFLLSALAVSLGCQVEKFFPQEVAGGVGRLTVRNSAVLVKQISADENCGFASQGVIDGMQLDGLVGGEGTLTLSVEDCVMDFGEMHVVSEDCQGVEMSLAGRVRVKSATQTVVGTLTGNPASPILPAGPDAVRIDIEAAFDGYEVRFSDKINALRFDEGEIAYTARPHLAQNVSLGVCGVVTPNLTLEGITWRNGVVTADSGEGEPFPVEIPSSSYDAQVGPYQNATNRIDGEITVWETTVSLPEPGGETVLDPDYTEASYLASFECTDDMALPVSYECKSLLPAQAQGVAALTVSAFGNLVSLANDRCFSTVRPTVSGEVGREGAEARYEVSDCVIDMPPGFVAGTDCTGHTTYLEGRVRVSGTSVLRGFSTGDIDEPIVPLSRDPATLSIDIAIESPIRVSDSSTDQALTLEGGSLSGTARPRTALDRSSRVCSFATPVAQFENVTLTSTTAVLEAAGNTFRLAVEGARLDAQNGKKGLKENFMAGSISIEGEQLAVPTEGGEPILNPGYDPTTFNASFMCNPDVVLPASDEACSGSFYEMIGENVGRLVIQTVGTVAGLVNADGDCGFDNTFGQLLPDEVIGEVGDQGSMSWSVEDCVLGAEDLSIYATDCMGATTYMQGSANIDAGRTVHGERETAYLLFDSIRPNFHEAVEVTLQNVELTEFVTYTVPADGGEPPGIMTIHQGALSAFVVPILGERASDPGMYDVTTPLARLSDVVLNDAAVTLTSEGKTFVLDIDDVNLSASNGIFEGTGNTLSGSLRVNGAVVEFGPVVLNPDFDPQSFNASYQCTDDLLGLIGE